MNGKELKDALKKLGISQRDFADIMGRDESTVSQWSRDKEEVPKYVESYLQVALQVRAAKETLSKPI